MKKLLLSLLAVLCMAGIASANTATLVAADLGLENAKVVDGNAIKVNDDITITFEKANGASQPAYYTKGSALRLYGGNTLTIQGASGVTITGITFTTGASNKIPETATVEPGTLAGLTTVNPTWTGSANKIVITNNETKGHARISKIEFTYTGGTGTGGGTVTPPETGDDVEVANLAAFAAGQTGVLTTVKSDAVAVCQAGYNLWIKDNSGWMLVYGNVGQTYENGDVIPGGYKGKLKNYNNLLEMEAPENFTKGAKTTPVAPIEVNTGDADGELMNSYIKMTGCTVTATSNARSYTCDDGSGAITLYTYSNSQTLPTGSGLTVYAFVSVFKQSIQFTPVNVTTESGREIVAAPYFTPAAGVVNKGTKVSIKSSTEGATIYYTLDGKNPTADSNVFTEAIEITEDVTIKALAVKEGMDDSDIVSAAYTVFVPSDKDATYNFADPSTLSIQFADADYVVDTQNEANKYVEIMDKVFTQNGLSLVVAATDPANAGTPSRLYFQGASSKYTLRVYNKSSLTIAAPAGNKIQKVAFEFANGTNSSKNVTAPTEGNWVAPVWTAPAGGVDEVTFPAKGTLQISTITITCDKQPSGVEDVIDSDNNAPVEFFNLQGVRVENPENGLYIRRQGNKVSKVIIR